MNMSDECKDPVGEMLSVSLHNQKEEEAKPSGIVPRARVNPNRGFSPEWYAPLPVLFPHVQETLTETAGKASLAKAFGASESTMGNCSDAGMSTSINPEQREAWSREWRGLTEAALKERYPGEATSHARIMSDARAGKFVVAERWTSFRKFMEDMGPKPDPSHTLDRINPRDPVYGPGKCRWLGKVGQARNRTSNVFLRATLKGEVLTLTVAEWAERTGQKATNIYQRRKRRGPGVPDWKVIGRDAGPTPDDAPAAEPHPVPPGWERCPRSFAFHMERQGARNPPKNWVMHHLAFQRATPPGKRLLATVPVFLAWHARERITCDEQVLLDEWGLQDWGGSGYVPKALLGQPLLERWLLSGAILRDAESMLTDAEWTFYGSLRVRSAALVNRYREAIRDGYAPVRAAMGFARPLPSVVD